MIDLHLNPALHDFADLARRQPNRTLLGHSQSTWREMTRLELGLAVDRPIIATGHQTLLWHPGILAKYMVMDAVADAHGFARANLIVDQHVDHFGEFEVPVRSADGSLTVRSIELVHAQPDVPMGLQRAFTATADVRRLSFAAPCVEQGVHRILQAVNRHRDAQNAAMQMACVLSDLMSRWVKPVTHVTATELGQTSLSRALLEAMVSDPHGCAEAYNAAVLQVPGAGIGTLLVRPDYVELPLWRIRGDGRRMRAYDNDIQNLLDDPALPPLLPRALFMTALVRLGMCDVFIHGTGGANYDRTMELWIRHWLGVEVAPIAVATATLRLPLLDASGQPVTSAGTGDIEKLRHDFRHIRHDPKIAHDEMMPSVTKQAMLEKINALPRRSPQRKAAFIEMHRRLELLRSEEKQAIDRALGELESSQRHAADERVAMRRDWPFALYPQEMLDELAGAVRSPAITAGLAGS